MSREIVTIIGNIGVGKSSAVDAIGQLVDDVVVVQEPVAQWRETGLLAALYHSLRPDASTDERQCMAYVFQQFAFASRLTSIKRIAWPSDKLVAVDGHVLVDRHVFASHLHDTGAISDAQWRLYNSTFADWRMLVPEARPTRIIYLRALPETCLQRIKERGRSEEQGIPLAYLTALHQKLEAFVDSSELCEQCPVSIVDANNNDADYIAAQVLHLVQNTKQ